MHIFDIIIITLILIKPCGCCLVTNYCNGCCKLLVELRQGVLIYILLCCLTNIGASYGMGGGGGGVVQTIYGNQLSLIVTLWGVGELIS